MVGASFPECGRFQFLAYSWGHWDTHNTVVTGERNVNDKKSEQLYQYSKLYRPVCKDRNTNNKIHCTLCPQQSSETKAEG